MNVIFLTLLDISDVNERGIYHDLLRKFRGEGHNVYVIYSSERRKNIDTAVKVRDGITLVNVRTLNIQKTNLFEKGLGSLLLEYQFLNAFKKFFSNIHFDLVFYSTPPITLTKVIKYIKEKDGAQSYLLLKDIFPQNAIDLGMMKSGGLLHRFFRRKEKQLYNISDYIGCMSPANVDYVLKHNPEISPNKIEVNPNSIDPLPHETSPTEKKTVRDKYRIPQEAIVFIYGGNLGKPQGMDFLVEVLVSNSNRKDVFFVIVGSGTAFPLVETWYGETRPNNVLLLQYLAKKEYDQLVRACDVGLIFLDRRFTIPNFPSRLLTYLENRMPVLAATDRNTDIGRIIEEAGCGLWCESGDLNGFNNQLNKLVTDSTRMKEMGEYAYKLLMNHYTVNNTYSLIKDKIAYKRLQ